MAYVDNSVRNPAMYVVLCLILSAQYISTKDHNFQSMINSNFIDVVVAMNNVLNFMMKHYDQLNVDALLGVVLGQAQLEMAQEILFENQIELNNFRKILHLLIKKCTRVVTITKNVVPITTKEYLQFFKILLNPNIWHVKPAYVDVEPFSQKPLNWTIDELHMNVYFGGLPNEQGFDQCFGNLLENLDRKKQGHVMECEISNRCYDMILRQNISKTHGYVLSHRLLFLQIFRAIGCSGSETSLQRATYKLCSQMYSEALTIKSYNFPVGLRDMFLEQVLLCGMEGYYQYLNPKWIKKILRWQHPEGCFSSTFDPNRRMKRKILNEKLINNLYISLNNEFSDYLHNNHNILHLNKTNVATSSGHHLQKRESSALSFNCSSHITGLTAGVFGLYAKDILASAVDLSRSI